MSLQQIYIIAIVVITVIILCMYIRNENNHYNELQRIERIEQRIRLEKEQLDKKRAQYPSCPVKNLTGPRSCYIDSDHKCKWNEDIEYCVFAE
jgi:hypothetical protein